MIAPAIALASMVWLALLIVTPFASPTLATLMYAAGGVICHQLPERSFHLGGFQIPVCARCLGIYVGAALAASIFVLGSAAGVASRWQVLSPQFMRRLFLVSVLPTLLTVVLEWQNVWAGANSVRAIAGAIAGIGSALVVMSAAATLHYNGCQRPRPVGSSQIPPHF